MKLTTTGCPAISGATQYSPCFECSRLVDLSLLNLAHSSQPEPMPKKPSSSDDDACGHCERRENTMFRCSRCGLIKYCSRPCQKAAWGEHKPLCIPKADRVPQPSLSEEQAATDISEGEECAICLDPLALGLSLTLPCGHTFHALCVEGLRKFGLAKAQLCPMCRKALPPGPENVFDEASRRCWIMVRKVERGTAAWAALNKAHRREMHEVARLYSEAATQGHAASMCQLGIMNHQGQGAKRSFLKRLNGAGWPTRHSFLKSPKKILAIKFWRFSVRRTRGFKGGGARFRRTSVARRAPKARVFRIAKKAMSRKKK